MLSAYGSRSKDKDNGVVGLRHSWSQFTKSPTYASTRFGAEVDEGDNKQGKAVVLRLLPQVACQA